MNNIDYFLHVYFYLLEHDLNTFDNGLSELKFQSEEANTDEEVKIFFKNYITQNNNIQKAIFSKIRINRSSNIFEQELSNIKDITISKVYLPKELSEQMKKDIQAKKNSVYTNPDLYLEILDENKVSHYISIELKTTKTNKIPGSSVQQISPFEWVIFVRHNDKNSKITCGYYINSITENLPFPDRSPRPTIAFDILDTWNTTYRNLKEDILEYNINTTSEAKKELIIKNWEKVLCDEWLETIHKDSYDSEKWFNNTIRLYTLNLLKKIQDKSIIIEDLIEKLENNIKFK